MGGWIMHIPACQHISTNQWCSQDQSLKAKAKAFKHTARAEIKIFSTPDSLTEQVMN